MDVSGQRYFSHHHSEIQSIYFHVMAPPLPRASESSMGPPRSAARLGQESTENYVGGFCGHSCTQFIRQNSATWSHLNARATKKAYYGEMLLRRKKKEFCGHIEISIALGCLEEVTFLWTSVSLSVNRHKNNNFFMGLWLGLNEIVGMKQLAADVEHSVWEMLPVMIITASASN